MSVRVGWVATLLIALTSGCAMPWSGLASASKVDKAVEAAAADDSFPSAAEAGLATVQDAAKRS